MSVAMNLDDGDSRIVTNFFLPATGEASGHLHTPFEMLSTMLEYGISAQPVWSWRFETRRKKYGPDEM